MSAKQFNVWLTTPTKDYVHELVGRLVRRGFTVGPLGRSLVLSYSDNPATMIAMSLQREPRDENETKEYTCSGVYAEVLHVIKTLKGKYLSIVVTESSGCTWNIGNVSLEEEAKEREKELKQVN